MTFCLVIRNQPASYWLVILTYRQFRGQAIAQIPLILVIVQMVNYSVNL